MKASSPYSSSLDRTLRDLPALAQSALLERYERLTPVLQLILERADIIERNRAWPGVRPIDKGATRWLVPKQLAYAYKRITRYAEKSNDSADDLKKLFYAYCRYGPIGLLDALPDKLPELIPPELQECATFHRLAKYPRSDAGIYIRELLGSYADDLSYSQLPAFVARYAFATERKIERWFLPVTTATEHVPRMTRRLNMDQPYPHCEWQVALMPLNLHCRLGTRYSEILQPWLIWMIEAYTNTLMGFRICPNLPTTQDIYLTLRWSIWHYDAPWWKARGAPDGLVIPAKYALPDFRAQRGLRYIHTQIRCAQPVDPDSSFEKAGTIKGWPENFAEWLRSQAQRSKHRSSSQSWLLADIRAAFLEYMQEETANISARSTPEALIQQGCSLPWSTGIGATLLLPYAGQQRVIDQRVTVWGVPYDLSHTELAEGSAVDIHYDPDDARAVFAVHEGAHVARAPACAFEHRTNWYELIENPLSILVR